MSETRKEHELVPPPMPGELEPEPAQPGPEPKPDPGLDPEPALPGPEPEPELAVDPGAAVVDAIAPADEDAPPAAAPASPPEPLFVVSVGMVAWFLAGLVFILLRVGPVLGAPVGGAELVHLSGAWQASIGVDDERYVPTLFQTVASLLLRADDSELPARAFAFLLTATVPAALWRLRPVLGDAGALIALAVLALDGPGILLGSTASAMAADIAVTLWLAVFLLRGWPAWWAPGVVAFKVATGGPLALPLLAGWAAVALWHRTPTEPRQLAAAAVGAALGIAFASARIGLGFDGLVVPPLDLFAAGFDEPWSTATVGDLALVYGIPVLLGGLAALTWELAERAGGEPLDRSRQILIAWAAFAAGWWLAAVGTGQAVPMVALSTPLALLIGPAAAHLLAAMWHADWRWARYLLPAAFAFAGLALAYVVDWARIERVGGTEDKLYVALWSLLMLAALALAGYYREARPTLAAPVFIVGAAMLVLGATGIVTSGREEPLPSPIAPAQARELRDLARETAAGGLIVIHPDFEQDMTWPFRDSGDIVVASRVPPDAAFVIWPPNEPAPEGFGTVQGQWAFRRGVEPPTTGALAYFHWLIDRNTLDIIPEPVAVYSRTGQ
ncbi:MAG: hypothetical protein IT303_03650 [Dehalococcoidia bacterium]|nr:hypothetical protein [Dehalococcoidia bacterium]